VGSGASALLLVFAAFLVRWFGRQDRLREQEEHDRRLKSLGQMSAVLAHEIRNPLASLKGNAQILNTLLERSEPRSDKTLKKAERVVGEAQRLEVLVNDLLDFARSGELRRERCDPAKLLRESAEAVGGDIALDLDGAPASWFLDATRMRQVLSNLLRNATEASDRVEASVSAEGGALVYRVRDHGAGFAADEAESLFEPFHTRKAHGTGLGLAVARRLVELHGGTIRASNATGGGAEFRIELPTV
jgi:two-component system sensor histidine kinase HydH